MLNKFFPERDYYNRVLIKLAKAGLARRCVLTNELEAIFPIDKYPDDSLFNQNDAISLFVNEMKLNKHIRFHSIIFKGDADHPDRLPSVTYELRITVEGLDYINKVRDRARWKWGILITIVGIIIAIVSLFKDFRKDTESRFEQTKSIQAPKLPAPKQQSNHAVNGNDKSLVKKH